MWRQYLHRYLHRSGRLFWRSLLWCVLLLLLLSLPLLAVLGSEAGSRWVLERGIGMQKTLTVEYRSGTFLGGLELANAHLRLTKLDLQIRHVLARWSLLQLLRGEVGLDTLQVEGVVLRITAPSSHTPVTLPLLVLPVRLMIHQLVVSDASLWAWQARAPLTLQRLSLSGQWWGSKLKVQQLVLDQQHIGRLQLQGSAQLRGGYPLSLDGRLDYLPFHAQGWQPLSVSLRQEVADLSLLLGSKGVLTATLSGHIKPLLPTLPYSAALQWQAITLPSGLDIWSDQLLATEGGRMQVKGDLEGLQSSGNAQLSGKHVPSGQYAWKGRTNWSDATIESFKFNGLGGNLNASGDISWHNGLTWRLASQFNHLDLAKKWPALRMAAPALTGKLDSKGRTTEKSSDITASLRLAGGESWDLQETGRSWLWSEQAPQEARLRWANVQRSLPGLGVLSSHAGRLDVKGSLSNYHLALDTDLENPQLPAGHWVAEAVGKNTQLSIERIAYAGTAGLLDFAGQLNVGTAISWQGALVLTDFTTAWLSSDWSGQFSGRVNSQGVWGARREVHVEDSELTGTLHDQPVRVTGALEMVLPVVGSTNIWPQLWTSGLALKWGDDQTQLKGGLHDGKWDLSAQLNLADLALLGSALGPVLGPALRADIQGSVQGHIEVRGAERLPDIQADLQADKAGVSGVYAASTHLQLNLARLGESPSTAKLEITGLTNASEQDFGQLVVNITGTQADHQIAWRAGTDSLHGEGTAVGGWDNHTQDWRGQMSTGQITQPALQWQLAAPFALSWVMTDKELHAAAHCWQSDEASLCSEQELVAGRTGHAQLRLNGLQAARLSGLLPESMSLTGLVNGSVKADWTVDERPTLFAELHADDGQLLLARDESLPPLVLGYKRIALTADALANSAKLQLDLDAAEIGHGHIEASIDPYAENKPLQGQLMLEGLRMDVFQPFFPMMTTLAGVVSAKGRLDGDLQHPQFWGAIELAKGELGLRELPVNITAINTRIDVQGTAADIHGDMHSGAGGATLSGHADWGNQPYMNLSLKGQHFELRQLPELLAEVDPDLQLNVVPGQIDLTGSIRVPTARINLKPLTESAVPLSSDVTLVSDANNRQRLQVNGAAKDWAINADISVLLGDDVYFHGYGVNGRLLGGLRLRQQGKKGLEANGEIELDKDSRYEAYGQRLQIRRGRLIFAGNLHQPGLDVEAVRAIDNQVVGVKVEGRADAPVATLFSDTAMSQEEIISYLVFGRPLDTSGKPSSGGANLSAAAAAIKLGATGGAGLGLTDRVGGALGITDLAVDAEGSGDDTQFTVSGYISPKLYLRYGMGIFTPVNTITVRYKLSAKLYLEAVSSLESAIDIFYNWRF
jgi:translocation and assembly module TamB